MNTLTPYISHFLLVFITLFSFQATAVERLYFVAADEIEAANEEGIKFLFYTKPKKLLAIIK